MEKGCLGALGYMDLWEEVSGHLLSSPKPTYLRNASCSSPQTLISGGAGGSSLSLLEGWPMAQEQSLS